MPAKRKDEPCDDAESVNSSSNGSTKTSSKRPKTSNATKTTNNQSEQMNIQSVCFGFRFFELEFPAIYN